ncbi:DUF86 domain-containing protein [Halobacteriovorax sp. HLS]|uniref:HepT-like ribonuclease domain-containing protein n=1 Tax=Halobacteriovorax sp. HLS TaxID=2234000 RepID=UPI000FD87723|nr:HepT-like ribonuclease domain-containing protein [Halobacteriovorax sp. HLS]
MSKKYKSDKIYLEMVIEHCERIKEYSIDLTLDELQKKGLVFDGILMRAQAIGENISKIENGQDNLIRNFRDTIDWSGLKRFRDVISHRYEQIRPDILFNFIQIEIDKIIEGARQILKQRY